MKFERSRLPLRLRPLLGAGVLLALAAFEPAPGSAQAGELPALEAAAKAAPKDLAAQSALGRAYLRAGRFADAAKQFERAEGLAPLDPQAVTQRAEVAIAQGDYKQARNQCKKLFKEQKGSALAHVCMARAFLAWNRSERAFEELAAATAQDPNLGEAQLVLGHAHRIRNQVAEAETAYKRGKENRGLAAEAGLGLGRLYAAAGQKDDAVASLREALSLDPLWPEIQYELGVLLGSTPEARNLLAQAVAGRPGWADAARALGDAQRQAGELAGAEDGYRKALATDRNMLAAHLGLAEVLLAKAQPAEAEAEVKAALALVANDARATLLLAEIQVKQGLVDEGIDTFRHAADLRSQERHRARTRRGGRARESPHHARRGLPRPLARRPPDQPQGPGALRRRHARARRQGLCEEVLRARCQCGRDGRRDPHATEVAFTDRSAAS
ncbi:MAG: tetratricopeptide repeat protein [Myxococcales bacterium]